MEKRVRFQSVWLPWLLVAPQMAIVLVFFFWPAGQALYQSVLQEDAFGGSREFVGLDNFARLWSDTSYLASFKTTVASVQAYRAGDRVSYDGTWTLQRDSLLANLPVGYSDGYRRAHSNKADVLVRGRRAPVLGNVTMNTTMVDVTDIPGVQAGDEVVLFGAQGQERITQAEIEKISGVVLADQYTIWGASNPKIVRR